MPAGRPRKTKPEDIGWDVESLAETILQLPREIVEAEFREMLEKPKTSYSDDPDRFIRDTLHITPWQKQLDIITSVRDNRLTVVDSGHATGKSYSAAALVCWWMTTHTPATVVTVAPTWSQVSSILWRGIRALGRPANLPGQIMDTPRWVIDAEHLAIGLSPRKSARDTEASKELATTIQGYHGPNLLVILDEAPGLPRMVWEAAKSMASGKTDRILAQGNPISQSGAHWDATRSSDWHHIRINCFDHPNVVQDQDIIPGAVSRAWVQEMVNDCPRCAPHEPGALQLPWDEDYWYLPTNLFMGKVLGVAPPESEDQLISMLWVVDAQGRAMESEDQPILGIDVARHGTDDSVACMRKGPQVHWTRRRHGQDTIMLANWIRELFEETGAVRGYIDCSNGQGAGVYDVCRKQLHLPVIELMSQRAAMERNRFANQRAECWWRLREALRTGWLALPPIDDMLARDLTVVHYGYDDQGRTLMEDKDYIRKRLGRSPDAGDALAETFALPVNAPDVAAAMQSNVKELGGSEQANPRWHLGTAVTRRVTNRWRIGRR